MGGLAIGSPATLAIFFLYFVPEMRQLAPRKISKPVNAVVDGGITTRTFPGYVCAQPKFYTFNQIVKNIKLFYLVRDKS
jgi:hypothetical protein